MPASSTSTPGAITSSLPASWSWAITTARRDCRAIGSPGWRLFGARHRATGCDMPSPLLLLQDISLTFGATPVLSGAALAVTSGDRVCLVGRNGSGKSTLLRIAAGLIPPDSARRFAQPGATIRYLPQEPDLDGFPTTLEYVESGRGDAAATDRYRATYLLEQLGLTGTEDPQKLS